MTPPSSRQQWPRGPLNALHRAAQGSVEGTIAVLSEGSIDIDQGDPDGVTALIFAAHGGHSRVASILLNRGANASIAMDDGVAALHLSAHYGHLAVTVDLIKAGADLEARAPQGTTPLHLAAEEGHLHVMAALIEAGADVDCCSEGGSTPLFLAAVQGHLAIVKELLRANANPLLVGSLDERYFVPLDMAARHGHSEVVRELIQQVGIEGCGGGTGGVDALISASVNQHVSAMAILADAGVVDTGEALFMAVGLGREATVKFLLQQRGRRGPTVDYVNSRNGIGLTPLYCSIDVFTDKEDVPFRISPRVVRLLIDAGADTSSTVRITTDGDQLAFHGTPLALTNLCLRTQQLVGGNAATKEQMDRLEAVRRLLLRVEAVRAVSWLWVREPLLVGGFAEVPSGKTARKIPASGAQLQLMLPSLRRRRRGVLLAPLFRYSSYP